MYAVAPLHHRSNLSSTKSAHLSLQLQLGWLNPLLPILFLGFGPFLVSFATRSFSLTTARPCLGVTSHDAAWSALQTRMECPARVCSLMLRCRKR